jgi:uncharacterized protein YbbK (DUF523 family)
MKLLISACLLGERCRYDGKSKPLPAETLARLRERYVLVPVCPEQLGGLPTPRTPSERQGTRVVMKTGEDVTAQYRRGAEAALETARREGVMAALLKERSPSCGNGRIYDGSFTGTLTDGNGVTAELLTANGFSVYGESETEKLI